MSPQTIDTHAVVEIDGRFYLPLGDEVLRSRRSDDRCPVCGSDPAWSRETGVATYGLVRDDRERLAYDGEGTDTQSLWNTFDTARLGSLPILICSSCDATYVTKHVEDLDEIR